MFEKRKDSSAPDSSSRAPEPATAAMYRDTSEARNTAMIGPTIQIKGAIKGEENLVIEGRVEGSVELSGHDLTVGQKGQVDADLNARTVKVEGQITGDISGSEKVIITKSGRVLGNIIAPRVTLEDGAKFKGSIDMDPGVESTSTRKGSASPVVSASKTAVAGDSATKGVKAAG